MNSSTSSLPTDSAYVSKGILGHDAKAGSKLTHIIEVRDEAPCAVRLTAVCGGLPAWIRIDSGVGEEKWEAWKNLQAYYKDWPETSNFYQRKPLCPRCVETYEKRRARVES